MKFLSVLLFALLAFGHVSSLKHTFRVHQDDRTLIGPIGYPFGFLKGGVYNLTVKDFRLKGREQDTAMPGFFLKEFESESSFNHFMTVLHSNKSLCAFDFFMENNNNEDEFLDYDDYEDMGDDMFYYEDTGDIVAEYGIPLTMSKQKWQPNIGHIDYVFEKGEEGLYFLMYQVCHVDDSIKSSFSLDFHFKNVDSFGNDSYLTAGEMILPLMFFFFTVSYGLCLGMWMTNIRQIQDGKPGLFSGPSSSSTRLPTIYPIHHLMTVLLILKTLSILFESIRYHYIKVSGHAELWSFVYYSFAFLKGAFLFTVILLIGSGWSFVKPFLTKREKKTILAVLVLQVVNNLAIVVLSQETEGESSYTQWMALLHLVDILCCCAVLLPIVWHVSALEKSVENEENNDELSDSDDLTEKGQILNKLRRFRTFYLLVVAYIYITRIVVYFFAAMLDYRHLWVRSFVVEMVTLLFYVVTGLQFRPMAENPYFHIRTTNNEDDVDAQLNEEEKHVLLEMQKTGKQKD